ncbi:hypothetical protein ACFWY6_30020 [Streptomyces sp. NPDC059037]|uniref:hypothetical protein n=1 Tax=Streptomyces sp. NPDC059037 TaxID=3346710 RepID=UPI0036A93370
MVARAALAPAADIVRACPLLAAAIALGDGLWQLAQGAPAGSADADNLRRFVAGAQAGNPAGGRELLRNRFEEVVPSRTVWRNTPPAFVLHARRPRP